MSSSAPKAHLTSHEEKAVSKAALQARLGWPAEPRRACVCLPTGLTESDGGPLFEQVMEGVLTLPVQVLILGKGSEHYGKLCTRLAKEKPHQVAIIPSDASSLQDMLRAADVALFCSPQAADMYRSSFLYGIVPVAPAGADVQNYNPNQESGNAFTFDAQTPWHCFAAVVRAVETYKFPFDWKTIQRNGLETLSS